eukprot:66930-Chlamydomonas_euryale.AAC.6
MGASRENNEGGGGWGCGQPQGGCTRRAAGDSMGGSTGCDGGVQGSTACYGSVRGKMGCDNSVGGWGPASTLSGRGAKGGGVLHYFSRAASVLLQASCCERSVASLYCELVLKVSYCKRCADSIVLQALYCKRRTPRPQTASNPRP